MLLFTSNLICLSVVSDIGIYYTIILMVKKKKWWKISIKLDNILKLDYGAIFLSTVSYNAWIFILSDSCVSRWDPEI